ncbi:MAG: universal stress protein [Desulforhopalus sp.]
MKNLKNIILYADDDLEPGVMERSLLIAQTFNVRIIVVHVVEASASHTFLSEHNLDLDDVERQMVAHKREVLTRALQNHDCTGIDISVTVLIGDPLQKIIELTDSLEDSLLIKAPSPDYGLRNKLFGGIDLQLMRSCPCPVEIGRPKTQEGGNRIVIAIDYDGTDKLKYLLNERLLAAALLAVSGRHLELYVLHAWTIYGHSLLASGRGKLSPENLKKLNDGEYAEREEWLQNRVNQFKSNLDEKQAKRFTPRLEILRGKPIDVIPQRVEELNTDLLCLGTASRSGLKALLVGNSAEEIIQRVNCTVGVLKPEGFESPISS